MLGPAPLDVPDLYLIPQKSLSWACFLVSHSLVPATVEGTASDLLRQRSLHRRRLLAQACSEGDCWLQSVLREVSDLNMLPQRSLAWSHHSEISGLGLLPQRLLFCSCSLLVFTFFMLWKPQEVHVQRDTSLNELPAFLPRARLGELWQCRLFSPFSSCFVEWSVGELSTGATFLDSLEKISQNPRIKEGKQQAE